MNTFYRRVEALFFIIFFDAIKGSPVPPPPNPPLEVLLWLIFSDASGSNFLHIICVIDIYEYIRVMYMNTYMYVYKYLYIHISIYKYRYIYTYTCMNIYII
jgi:hypothetical protein